MVKLIDVLGGIVSGAQGLHKGWNEAEDRRDKRKERENRENRDNFNQMLQMKKYQHMVGESERKQQQEQEKQTKKIVDDLAQADLLEYYVDQYISNKKKALSGTSLFGVGDVSIPGTEQFESNKIAQN